MPTIDHQRRVVGFHAPGTGTTRTRQVMAAQGAEFFGRSHDPFRLHVWAAQGWTSFGTVRNPWDWYAGWWGHVLRNHPRGFRQYGSTFRTALRKATGDWWLHERAGVYFDFDYTTFNCGLCSGVIDSIYDDSVDYYVPTDRLHEGLTVLLGLDVDGAFDRHGPAKGYASWYDDEMVRWVGEADAGLIQRFGFEPFTPSLNPIYKEN